MCYTPAAYHEPMVVKQNVKFIHLCLGFLAICVFAACSALGESKPVVIISSPPGGSQYQAAHDVVVQSTSSDPQGIVRVELLADGATVRMDPSPTGSPQAQFTVIQIWKPNEPGQHTLTIRATDAQGVIGEAVVTITVIGEIVGVTPTPTNVPPTLPPLTTAPPLIPTATPVPTVPPQPTTPPPSACTNIVQFIADVTIPDAMWIAAGEAFVKTWRVRNAGSCIWDAGYTIEFVAGEQFGAPSPALIPQAAPNEVIDVSLSMVAPAGAGEHTSAWRLRASNGVPFGSNLTAVINVPDVPPPPHTGQPDNFTFSATSPKTLTGGSTTPSWNTASHSSSPFPKAHRTR